MENNQLAIRSVDELAVLGEAFQRSRIFGCKEDGQGLVVAMTCITEGISPLKFSQRYHIIKGNVTMKADAMLAEFNRRGGRHIILKRDENEAAIKLIDRHGAEKEFAFTWEDAKKEPFVYCDDGKTFKTNYNSPRARMQMLWARLVSDAVRAVDPGVNEGTYTPEEISDIPEKPVEGSSRVIKKEAPAMAPVTEEATKKVEPEVVTPEVVQPPSDIDYNLIPFGKKKGQNWNICTEKQLRAWLDCKDQPQYQSFLFPGHVTIIEKLLAEMVEKSKS